MKLIDQNSNFDIFRDAIYEGLTNNGIIGVPSEDGKNLERHQATFKDLFKMHKDKELKDTFETTHFTRAFGEAIERVIEFAVEPQLVVLPNLFRTLEFTGRGRQIEIGSIGAIHAEHIPEGQEYPEVQFSFGSGDMISVGLKKHGLKVSVTEEVIEDDLFDVFGLFLTLAGKALGRHKEESAVSLIQSMGEPIFDNASAADSYYGSVSGRGIDGNANGTMDVNDMIKMMAFMMERGFNPDTALMNPMAWQMFMSDPNARETFLAGNVVRETTPNGDLERRYNLRHGKFGYWNNGTGKGFFQTGTRSGGLEKVPGNNPFTNDLNPLGATYTATPKNLGAPIRIIVTPHVPFLQATIDAKTKYISDFVIADSDNCGILFQKGGVKLDDWKNPETDIQSMKVKERWGMDVMAQGKAIAVARNIVLDKNYAFQNVNSQSLSDLDSTADLVA